jgi:hypothetical protein
MSGTANQRRLARAIAATALAAAAATAAPSAAAAGLNAGRAATGDARIVWNMVVAATAGGSAATAPAQMLAGPPWGPPPGF